MRLHNMNYVLSMIMVSSSMGSWAMASRGVIASHKGLDSYARSQEEHDIALAARIRSVTPQPQESALSLAAILRQSEFRRASAPADLRRSVATALLMPEAAGNAALRSPTANSFYNSWPMTPRTPGSNCSPITPETPETPATPSYELPFSDLLGVDVHWKTKSAKDFNDSALRDDWVIERIAVFPKSDFSHNSTNVAIDFGVIWLIVDHAAKSCRVHKVELNDNNNVVKVDRASLQQTLELRATALAAEREKAL